MTTKTAATPRTRPLGSKSAVVVTLRWRDENYGRIGGTLAFRTSVDPFPSEIMSTRLAHIYKRHGFLFNDSRAAFIATSHTDTTPAELVQALAHAGYTVKHAGCIPDTIRPSIEALRKLRAEHAENARLDEEARLWGAIEDLTDEQLLAAAAGCTDEGLAERGSQIIAAALAAAYAA